MNTHCFKIRSIALCTVVGLSTVQTAPAQVQQQATPARIVDSAMAPAGFRQHLPIKRIAPDAAVDQFDLGPVLPRPANVNAPADYRDFREEVGYVEDVTPGLLSQPNWTTTANGARVWTVELFSSGGAALRACLRGRWGYDGLELRVYDPVSGNAFGPYTRPNLNADDEWWTTIIFGESIGLEFYQPADGESRAMPQLPELTAVAKHWGDDGSPRGGLGCTHLDLLCSPAWVDEGEAVCSYSYVEGGSTFVCTGSLINRSPSDLSPLLLTADHCIDSQVTAATVACFWFFQNDACDLSPPANTNGFPRTDASIVLKTRNNSDVSLLGLVEPPAANLWLGWDAGGWTLQSDATGIHHPGGTFKRVSFGDVTSAIFVTYGQNDTHVWRVGWDSGSTEGGSSGSPVLDTSGRIRGQLKGGDCNTGDYGRFGVSFDTLEPYISNMASPVYVEAGAGGSQLGTSGDPFNSAYEATFCVFAGDEVRIRAANYNERFRLWRPMTLNAEGGTVRIGQP